MNTATVFVMIVFSALLGTGLFFFVATRGALIARKVFRLPPTPSSHVYPLYSNMRLIKLVDFQPIISAILLFQYKNLVDRIVAEIARTGLRDKKALITSCAFGNVIPRITEAAVRAGVERVIITDIVKNELTHAKSKLSEFGRHAEFVEGNATCMKMEDGAVDLNIMFFLLHELPHEAKVHAIDEAARVLRSGGKLIIAEFHRPRLLALRVLSYLYFKVFEPHGLPLWDVDDPVRAFDEMRSWTYERETFLFANFQVIVATKA
jgi:ubiquinone/menaquinone biosynthesis C-methylase UbiE